VQVVVSQVWLVQQEDQVKMVDLVNPVLQAFQATLVDHQWLATQSNHHHAKNARRDHPDHPATPDHQVTRDLKDQLARTAAVPRKDHPDQLELLVKTDQPEQMDQPVMQANPVAASQSFPEMQDQRESLDQLETKDHPDHLAQMEEQVNQDPKDHQDPTDHQDQTAQMVRPAQTDPQDLQEKRVSVQNIARWMAASSLKAVPHQQDLRQKSQRCVPVITLPSRFIRIEQWINWYSDQNNNSSFEEFGYCNAHYISIIVFTFVFLLCPK